MNVYSDFFHTALKYLKDAEVNILNLFIMTGVFNIRDNIWDPSFPHHSAFSNDLMIVVDSFNLELSFSTHHVPTRYLDSDSRSNSVINLMFLQSGLMELNNYSIHLDLCLFLNYASLSVSIAIKNKNIDSFKSPLQKTVKRKKTSSRMSHMLSKISISQTYLIIANLKKLPICLYQELNIHGKQMLNKSEL